jgi:hypothetical protein
VVVVVTFAKIDAQSNIILNIEIAESSEAVPISDSNFVYVEYFGGFVEIGGVYEDGIFYPIPPTEPCPYPSWSYDRLTGKYMPPAPWPTDGLEYDWDESKQQWVLLGE